MRTKWVELVILTQHFVGVVCNLHQLVSLTDLRTQHPKTKMSKVTEVSEELDKVLIEVMATLDELSSLRDKYSGAVSEGYFYMSQARHSMGGPSAVSSLQYDGRMSALVHIEPSPELESYDELTKLHKDGLTCTFEVERTGPLKPAKKTAVERKSTEMGESQLRRRKVDKDSVEDVPLSRAKDSTTIEGSSEAQAVVKDPIKWFGILVPPYLHRSQDHFKQVVLLVAELASTQTRLEALRRRFRELLKEKNKK